ncbi:MAG: hypothetical protein AAGC82_09985 [Pseudomonadota bacterium]
MSLPWIDATSYAQGQRGKTAQTAWATEIDGLRIFVSCGHLNHPGTWVLACKSLSQYPIELTDSGASSEEALDLAIEKVWSLASQKALEFQGIADTAFAALPLCSQPAREGGGDE